MDEARLLDSLHHKLQDLESKLRAYRGDLIRDFQSHYHGLLRGVNPDIALSVQQAIVSTFVNYPTLRPDLAAAADLGLPPDVGSHSSLHGPAASKQPPLSTAKDSRQREQDLSGLFIPSYLPLLQSSPTAADTLGPPTAAEPLSPVFEPTQPGTSMAAPGMEEQKALIMQEIAKAPQMPVDAGLGLKAPTDDSTSSVCSDKSDSKARRSAMRRSSSLSKPPKSPRRVRFEFVGTEVLPTASPQAKGAFADDESINSDTVLDSDPDEDPVPPPRKISSSEALRALSRVPVEDGTIWTVVNSNADASEPQSALPSRLDEDPIASEVWEGTQFKNPPLEDADNEPEANDESGGRSSDDEEDDYLAMRRPRSLRSIMTSSPSLSTSRKGYNEYIATPGEANRGPTSFDGSEETKYQDLSDEEFDDDMFQFEPGGLTAPPKPRQTQPPPPPPLDAEDDSDGDSQEMSPLEAQMRDSPTMSSSLPMTMRRPPNIDPTAPPMTATSVGSYKGRPVVMPVVKDPEVYARAASLGKFNTFVGGLDGRSGIDEGDLSSFRTSVVHSVMNDAPRSFSERLMMEEALDREEDVDRM